MSRTLSKTSTAIAVPLALLLAAACTDTSVTAPAAKDALFSKTSVGSAAGSLGKVTVDTEVSSWNVGSGNPNGEFITAENSGVVIGLRAIERFVGLLGVTGDRGNRVAVYEAPVGPSPGSGGDNTGTWNYDWHVDLSNATGRHAGKVLSDYRLVLEQDFTAESLFGTLGSDPVVLIDGGIVATCVGSPPHETLCQQSWNPGFGNSDYDPGAERTFNLRLILTPATFNGSPLAVAIRVEVSND